MVVWHGECGQGKDKQGKLHGPPGHWGTGEHYNTEVHKGTFPPVGPITDLMGSKVACIGLGNAYSLH